MESKTCTLLEISSEWLQATKGPDLCLHDNKYLPCWSVLEHKKKEEQKKEKTESQPADTDTDLWPLCGGPVFEIKSITEKYLHSLHTVPVEPVAI